MTYFSNTQTLEAEYTAAQTDTLILTATATQQIAITEVTVVIDEAVTATGVGFRMGCGTPGTPTAAGVVLSHPGLMPGQAMSRGTGAGVIAVGDFNEDLRITCENPVGGALRVIVSYFIVEQT
jgi:hypothetical protein